MSARENKMQKLGVNEIREKFLSFFEGKGHLRAHSFPLVPQDDDSLLLINSGMAPLKPFFSGEKTPPTKRMTTSQKCIRTGDIDNVGHTARHGTFFEMLGNFSFGDYFKKESIEWGYEFITEVLKIPSEKLHITVYKDDDEAYKIWNENIGIPADRLYRFGKKDNFWEIGNGPCGPCSEIFYDRGKEYGCGKEDCFPGCDCDRYLEFWNHVFTQFNKTQEGKYEPLFHPNIDTGMGLERMACIMQGVESIFDIDTISFIKGFIEGKAMDAKVRLSSEDFNTGLNVITDHLRSATFMLSDGILPSNEGRGYVLRRLLRRSIIHANKLGLDSDALVETAGKVIETSEGAYPELVAQKEHIFTEIKDECAQFKKTLDSGESILNGYIDALKEEGSDILDGERAFKLYDTFGFPIELTAEILEGFSMKVDFEGFKKHMEYQKELARKGRKNEGSGFDMVELGENIEPCEFTGYESAAEVAKVVFCTEADSEGVFYVILDRTPFYPRGGGQEPDTGKLVISGNEFCVLDVSKKKDVIVHAVKFAGKEGKGSNISINKGDEVSATVDLKNRNAVMANHTATHLMHAALRELISKDITQAGSKVSCDGLRFDINYKKTLSYEELRDIEVWVNDRIASWLPVTKRIMKKDEAIKSGAIGLFSDKYKDDVRVVSIEDASSELCGGLHVDNTGYIGSFKIVKESAVSSGTRRIEAITGRAASNYLLQLDAEKKKLEGLTKTQDGNVYDKVQKLYSEIKDLKADLSKLKKGKASGNIGDNIKIEDMEGIKFGSATLDDMEISDMKDIATSLTQKDKDLVLLLASKGEKFTMVMACGEGALDKGYKAGDLIKQVAPICGAKGGGKPKMAQAGGGDEKLFDDVCKAVLSALK